MVCTCSPLFQLGFFFVIIRRKLTKKFTRKKSKHTIHLCYYILLCLHKNPPKAVVQDMYPFHLQIMYNQVLVQVDSLALNWYPYSHKWKQVSFELSWLRMRNSYICNVPSNLYTPEWRPKLQQPGSEYSYIQTQWLFTVQRMQIGFRLKTYPHHMAHHGNLAANSLQPTDVVRKNTGKPWSPPMQIYPSSS